MVLIFFVGGLMVTFMYMIYITPNNREVVSRVNISFFRGFFLSLSLSGIRNGFIKKTPSSLTEYIELDLTVFYGGFIFFMLGLLL
jgi:hypothetical protein